MPTCVQNCKRTPGKKLKKAIPKFNGGGENLQKYIHIFFLGGGDLLQVDSLNICTYLFKIAFYFNYGLPVLVSYGFL